MAVSLVEPTKALVEVSISNRGAQIVPSGFRSGGLGSCFVLALGRVGASAPGSGTVSIAPAIGNISGVNPPAQEWLHTQGTPIPVPASRAGQGSRWSMATLNTGGGDRRNRSRLAVHTRGGTRTRRALSSSAF